MRSYILILFLGLMLHATAQQNTFMYFVSFTDKPIDSIPFSLPNYLSEKAIQRRTKLGVKVHETDYPVYAGYIDKICKGNLKFRSASKWLNGILIETNDSSKVKEIANMAFVKDFRLVGTYKTATKTKPSSEEKNEWMFDTPVENYANTNLPLYGKAFQQIRMLQGTALHQLNYTGKGITIAVMDAGYLNADKLSWFRKLQQNNQIVGVRDFVDNDSYVFDGNSHGLEVLSCMAASDTANYVGTAPGASFLLLRSEDAETEQLIEEVNWAIAAEYADSCGVDLITTSLGYNEFDDRRASHQYSELDGRSAWVTKAAEVAFSKGILVVCSAGNEGANAWRKIGFPADAPNAITVGAVNLYKAIAEFSSHGPAAEGRLKPDVCALGVDAQVCSPYGSISAENGTSFSTPIIAGMVACLMQAAPNKTPKEIADAVRKSADRYEIPDTFYGHGIPDMNMALFLLGDSSFDRSKDYFFHVNYNKSELLLNFSFYSATTQQIGFKIVDENGTIIRTGSQQTFGRKPKHYYIDLLNLPDALKGYGFIIENDAHKTFVKLF